MTSEQVPPPTGAHRGGEGGRGVAVRPRPVSGASGPASASSAAGVAFAVEWQVRPADEALVTEPRPEPTILAVAPRTGFTFDIARALGTVVVTARGTLDAHGARALRHVLEDLIESQGNMDVVVDLHDVVDVDVRCLDVFVTAHGWAVLRGSALSLTGARRRVAQALEETGVSGLVKVTSDRILALPAVIQL